MTLSAGTTQAADQADAFEVATVSADTLRASIQVSGPLTSPACGLLTSILRTHVTAGRRYLRVDVARSEIADETVVGSLVQAHRDITELGGMLILENAGPLVLDAIRADMLFVRTAG